MLIGWCWPTVLSTFKQTPFASRRNMGEKPRSFEIAFEGNKYVFGPLTLKDAITFCQKARAETPNPSNWVIAELDGESVDAGRQFVINAIDMALRQMSDAKGVPAEDRFLLTKDGLIFLFTLSLSRATPDADAEAVVSQAAAEEALDIAARILIATRDTLKDE